jgi:hypothetical protein
VRLVCPEWLAGSSVYILLHRCGAEQLLYVSLSLSQKCGPVLL